MGACLGHCFARLTDSLSYRFNQTHTRMSFEIEEEAEFTDAERSRDQSKGSNRKFKKKRNVPVTLELLEDGRWSRDHNKYARLSPGNDASISSGLDTSLQVLDAKSLLKQQTYISSTPGSSLDLEWEHEGLPIPMMKDEKVDAESPVTHISVNDSQASNLTASSWSRVSSPNSLEWDPVESDMIFVDVETEQLLTEIERLTDRALKETGEWTSSS